METRSVHCGACERGVVVMVPTGTQAAQDGLYDTVDGICLAYGEACTGAVCPVFGVPMRWMKESLDRSGFRPFPEIRR